MQRLETRCTPARSNANDTLVPPYPIESRHHGEQALYTVLALADSYRLTVAVMRECAVRVALGSGSLLAARMLIVHPLLSSIQGDQAVSFCRFPLEDRVTLARDWFRVYDGTPPRKIFLSDSETAQVQFFWQAMEEHLTGSAAISVSAERVRETFPQKDSQLCEAFGFLLSEMASTGGPGKASSDASLSIRKLRPMSLASPPTHHQTSDAPLKEQECASSASQDGVSRRMQEEMRRWFWWAHPSMHTISKTLVLDEGISQRHLLEPVICSCMASFYPASSKNLSDPVEAIGQAWIGLTIEMTPRTNHPTFE